MVNIYIFLSVFASFFFHDGKQTPSTPRHPSADIVGSLCKSPLLVRPTTARDKSVTSLIRLVHNGDMKRCHSASPTGRPVSLHFPGRLSFRSLTKLRSESRVYGSNLNFYGLIIPRPLHYAISISIIMTCSSRIRVPVASLTHLFCHFIRLRPFFWAHFS